MQKRGIWAYLEELHDAKSEQPGIERKYRHNGKSIEPSAASLAKSYLDDRVACGSRGVVQRHRNAGLRGGAWAALRGC